MHVRFKSSSSTASRFPSPSFHHGSYFLRSLELEHVRVICNSFYSIRPYLYQRRHLSHLELRHAIKSEEEILNI